MVGAPIGFARSLESWMHFAWVAGAGGAAAGVGGLCLGLTVVVPVTECADHVHGCRFAFVPLLDVCCFEVDGGWAS